MPASAHPQPLNAARAFEATLAPLAGHRPQTGGDGGIQLAHRERRGIRVVHRADPARTGQWSIGGLDAEHGAR